MNTEHKAGGQQGHEPGKHPADKAMTHDTTRDPDAQREGTQREGTQREGGQRGGEQGSADRGMTHDTTRDPDPRDKTKPQMNDPTGAPRTAKR